MTDKCVAKDSKDLEKVKRRFGCSLCSVICATRYGLEEHSRKHTGAKPFSCSKCNLSFTRKGGLRKHLQCKHGDSGSIQYKCTECSANSPVLGNIVRHLLAVHRSLKRFICSICAAKYAQNQELKNHLDTKHNVKIDSINSQEKKSIYEIHVLPPFGLDDRTADFVEELEMRIDDERKKLDGIEELISVIKRKGTIVTVEADEPNVEETASLLPIENCEEHKRTNKIDVSDKNEPTEKSPETWISFVLEKNANTSDEQLSIEDSVNIKQQVLIGNDAIDERNSKSLNIEVTALPYRFVAILKFPCRICNKIFTEEKKLLRHMKIHSDHKPHRCNECGKTFVEHHNLIVHYRRHTGERPYVCPICAKEIRYHKDFVDHCISHSGEKRYVCTHCNRGYRRKRDYDRHLFSHSNKNRFLCEICGKGFIRNYLKEQHILKHSLSEPTVSKKLSVKKVYECGICSKAYKTRQGLLHHKSRHSGLIEHQCHVCSKTFPVSNKLEEHLRNHIPRVKYVSCSNCQRMFSSDDTLKIHMDRYHKTESEDAIGTVEETVIYHSEISELPQNLDSGIPQTFTVLC